MGRGLTDWRRSLEFTSNGIGAQRSDRRLLSAGSVDVSSMLYAMDEDDLLLIQDLVDDPVVAATGRVQAFEFTDEWLAETFRVVCDGAKNGRKCSFANLLR